MATHSSILAWKIPWTEEAGWLQSMGLQRVGHDLATKQAVQLLLILQVLTLLSLCLAFQTELELDYHFLLQEIFPTQG